MADDTQCQKLSTNDGVKEGMQYKVLIVYPKLKTYLLKKRKILEMVQNNNSEIKIIIKSRVEGLLSINHVKPGDIIEPGIQLITVEKCSHPTVLGSICCDCGTVLPVDTAAEVTPSNTQGHISMLHSIPDLKVSRKEAERLGAEDISNLLENRKLVLLVDLDQTLIHTTNDNIPAKLEDVYHFRFVANGPWYHTRLRPYTKKFLEKISTLYELHICTFGVREYAHSIAKFLDPHEELFGPRILSRNECLDPMSKTANLSSLFPCGDNLVCIIDDRSDVWNFAPNVVQVMPYHFFKHTGDINAPPGLQKKESDEKQGFDFADIGIKATEYEKTSPEPAEPRSPDLSSSDASSSCAHTISTSDSFSSSDGNSISDLSANITSEPISSQSCDGNKQAIAVSEDEQDTEGKPVPAKVVTKDVPTTEAAKANVQPEKGNTEATEMDVDNEQDSAETEETDKVATKSDNVGQKTPPKELDQQCVAVVDNDDYLLYLEDILVKLHARFYKQYDYQRSNPLPDLKRIVPSMRAEVLLGVNIAFSSVIPHHVSPKNSKAWHVAISLGAKVTDAILVKPNRAATTHLITANLHTEKSKQATKLGINIVNPNWLWCCAERWERVEEQLFQVENSVYDRNPPLHCLLPKIPDTIPSTAPKKEAPNIMANINPLMFLSEFDTKDMKAEVDICMSDDSDNEDEESESSCTNSDDQSDCDGNISNRLNLKRKHNDEEDTSDSNSDDEDDQLPSVIFRQGDIPSELSENSESDHEPDEEMNAYGELLERQMMD